MTFRRMDPSYQFQSTLSVRRATWAGKRADAQGHISIHALREESDPRQNLRHPNRQISIHALREESDESAVWYGLLKNISIHALREESDLAYLVTEHARRNFNPRSP